MMSETPLRNDKAKERCDRLLLAWSTALDFGLKAQFLSLKTESNKDVFDELTGKLQALLNPRTVGQRTLTKRDVVTHEEEQRMGALLVGLHETMLV